jgi:hypothetical protein
LKKVSVEVELAEDTYRFIQSYSDWPSSKFLAVKFPYGPIRIFSIEILKDTENKGQ